MTQYGGEPDFSGYEEHPAEPGVRPPAGAQPPWGADEREQRPVRERREPRDDRPSGGPADDRRGGYREPDPREGRWAPPVDRPTYPDDRDWWRGPDLTHEYRRPRGDDRPPVGDVYPREAPKRDLPKSLYWAFGLGIVSVLLGCCGWLLYGVPNFFFTAAAVAVAFVAQNQMKQRRTKHWMLMVTWILVGIAVLVMLLDCAGGAMFMSQYS